MSELIYFRGMFASSMFCSCVYFDTKETDWKHFSNLRFHYDYGLCSNSLILHAHVNLSFPTAAEFTQVHLHFELFSGVMKGVKL